ncbi:MAG: hypothetical protein HYZ68_02805 [Chloroflexi bacterium]|nr:hypothetical protein [Chloroflexota bacterium]
MSLNDFLSLITRGTFVLIAVLTLVDFLRRRGWVWAEAQADKGATFSFTIKEEQKR